VRFRRLEDEQRYLALRTELYLRVAEALREQPLLCQEILRNLGKIEHVAFYEGVEQGAVASFFALELDEDFASLSAADMHRQIYAHHDTPLTEAERSPWTAMADQLRLVCPQLLVAPRAEYVPMTLQEVEGTAVAPAPVRDRARIAPATIRRSLIADDLADTMIEAAEDDDVLALDNLLASLPSSPEPDLSASPQLLDRIRDALVTRARNGWKPTQWSEVVLAAMQDTSIPAYTVDAQLATPEGVTVLRQAGMLDLEPSPWSSIAAMGDHAAEIVDALALGLGPTVDFPGDAGETPSDP
jgi:hypothetical protein